MKLLLLLLPVCALAFTLPDNKIVDKGKELLKSRYGKLTEEQKAKLAETWGIDINARKARLHRLAKNAATSLKQKMTSETDLKDRLKDIVPIATTKPRDDVEADLFEVNNIAGVSEFLFEGDMHLTESQLDALENERSTSRRKKRQAFRFANKWTNNTLYFYYDQSIDQRKKDSIRAAHEYLEAHTCINFVESRTARNRVKVYNGRGCSSAVGMSGGEQLLSLGNNCEVIGTAAHEFAHALGFEHTQSRSDRDTFVDVDLSDVEPGMEGNFEEFSPNENYLYTPYEYGGFLHYSANAFTSSRDSFSIVPKDSNYFYTMGNRQISFYDVQMINFHYNCNATCTAANSAVCQNGGYPNPRNCSVCNCPRGYGGDLCKERPSGCGETLVATEDWQKYQVELGDSTDNENIKDVFTTCNHWITAPQGKKIQVKITKIFNGQCQYSCPFNGIEIKANKNQNITNPLYCCEEFNNRIITSELNPTPLVSFNRYYVSTFDIEYRFVDGDSAPVTVQPATSKTTPRAPATRPTTAGTTTTPAPTEAPTCDNQLSLYYLRRLYNQRLGKNHYHSNVTVVVDWLSDGYRQIGQIGRVLNSNLCEETLENFRSFCPSVVKLRAFTSARTGAEYMTIEDNVAQTLINNGWQELPAVGYCSATQGCGASRNLRSVTARNGQNIVYSIYDTELNDLNRTAAYRGTLSGTICWLF